MAPDEQRGGGVRWRSIRVEGAEGATRDAIIAALVALGAGGVQEEGAALLTYLPADTDLAPLDAAASEATPAVRIETRDLGEVDWASMWSTRVEAHRLGRIAVAPPWLAEEVADAEHVVLVDPAMAFGTGEHPTTRGVIRLMQGIVRDGDVVADLGAGSAVLSIAAAKLGARRVYAIEMDPDAIGNAEENVARNGVADRVHVLHGDASLILPLVAPVRVVLANIISSVLVALSPVMRGALLPGGSAIISGILRTERDDLLDALAADGWVLRDEDAEGEWWSAVISQR
ncbi:MAG TPA: 50S ribosomal protein L11 methyltransferase [Gemmatimonadaceae bacterium]|nr:50S ribosomal protein L11 methyltransferase [Gemmatimonadaceae bacterium]